MGNSSSKSPASRNPTEQSAFESVQESVAQHGVDGIGDVYRQQLEDWRNVELNFCVTGRSGAGKSTFINCLLG